MKKCSASISAAAICSHSARPNRLRIKAVRDALKPLKMDDAPIQQSRQGNLNFISVRGPYNSSEQIEQQITQTMPKRWI